MNAADKKADRLLKIEAMLLSHPEGMTQAEIARRLDVNRSTIGRYLPSLPNFIYQDEWDGNRLKVDRSAYLVNVRFSLHEATAVHLASRLLATRMDRQNPHAAAALRKLGIALEKLAPHISHHLSQSADVMDDAAQRHDPNFLRTLEQLTLAWAEGRKIEVWHRHTASGNVYRYKFSPYFIEPYAVGQSVHVIGFREPPAAMRTFKIERIERVESLTETYTIPGDFDPRKLLADAWGIWYTEAEPVKVVLKFSPDIAQRVKETRWHPSEQITAQPDGSVLWEAHIAEPKEMLPWIRGFGADVEVLEPKGLRERLAKETRAAAEMYTGAGDIVQEDINVTQHQLSLLWAKANRANPKETHLLIYHLLESAAVGLNLWEHVFSTSIQEEYAQLFNLPKEKFGRLLAYWIGLHDLGKASPAFQTKIQKGNPELIAKIKAAGLTMRSGLSKSYYHSRASGKFLKEHHLVPQEVETAITGHHGTWSRDYRCLRPDAYGDQAWDEVRSVCCEVLRTVLGIQQEELPALAKGEESNIFTVWLSGVISVADWIASDESCFHYCNQWQDPLAYFAKAKDQAAKHLQKLGWIGWKPSRAAQSFGEMYAFKKWTGPRNIQQQAIAACQAFDPQEPFLMVVEAPTGIGKTEIALYLADRWLQEQQGSGIYIAMPTQATSNQLYERSAEILQHRYKDQLVNLVLAHGQARWNDDVNKIRIKEVGEAQGLVAAEWFQNNRKRTLLAPFGVGTVDQVFLSILQTRHFFVRLFGLKNKVVIFDEVHAYDTYMNALFHRLLEWLRSLHVSIIILSATLPENTRQEIVAHYCGIDLKNIAGNGDYPRLTMASANRKPVVTHLDWKGNDRKIKLHWMGEESLESLLEERLATGGCAAVICNTVGQAQKVYQRLHKCALVDEKNLILFHARFPFGWRKQIEERVLKLFGKEANLENGNRPRKAIVVATQVIEQSLDLDFDFMVTELAPVDLILQRVGRLHRHDRGDSRPARLQSPELAIVQPALGADGMPDFGKREPFYQKSVLAKTYYQLQPIKDLMVIADTRELIESVYQDEKILDLIPNNLRETLAVWQEEESSEHSIKSNQAGFTTIREPTYTGLTTRRNKQLVDDDSLEIIEHIRAKTRDGGISLRLPCVFSNDEKSGFFFDYDCEEKIDSENANVFYIKKRLSENEISISHIGLIHAIIKEGRNISQINPHLKPQTMLMFCNGTARTGQYSLNLSQELGLLYE